MSANLYKTKNEGEFFHIHGSLEATTTLNMIGLEGYRPDLTDYEDVIKEIESHVQKYSAAELEELNRERRQAGVTAFKYEDFIQTPHVRVPPLLAFQILTTTGQTQRPRTGLESHKTPRHTSTNPIPSQHRQQPKNPQRRQSP
jgi:hypothetical protein